MRFQYLGGCAVALIYCGAVIGPWPAVAPWLKLTWEDWCVFGALAIGVHFLAGTAQVTHSLDLPSRPHTLSLFALIDIFHIRHHEVRARVAQ